MLLEIKIQALFGFRLPIRRFPLNSILNYHHHAMIVKAHCKIDLDQVFS